MAKIRGLFLFFVVFVLLYVIPVDPDLWWHLRYGAEIISKHAVPLKDTFSYTMAGYHWADSYWLSEVVMYALYKLGGLWLIPFVFSALISAILVIFTRRYNQSFLARLLSLSFVSVFLLMFLVPSRPHAISAIFLTVLWFTLIYEDVRKKLLVLLPPLFLIWANFHADFVIGLGLFSAYIFFEFLKERNVRQTAFHILILLLSFAATFVNPYGIGLHKALLNEIISMGTTSRNISEWVPVSTSTNCYYIFIFLLAIIVWVLFFDKENRETGVYKEISNKPFFYVAILLTSVLSLRSAYYIKILVIISIPIIHLFLLRFFTIAKLERLKLSFRYLNILMLWVSAFLFTVLLYKISLSGDIQRVSRVGNYPYDAAVYLNNHPLTGKMFNDYVYGSYFIFTAPETKTFIDGRMTTWKDSRGSILQTFTELTSLKDKNKTLSILDKYDVMFVVDKRGSKLVALLIDEGWHEVYKDPLSVIITRTP